MKKLTLLLLAVAVASNAFAWIDTPAQGEYREFTGPGERPDAEGEPLIENSIEGEYREFTGPAGNVDPWILGMLWLLRV